MNKKYKRRKIIINHHFQWKYTMSVLFTVLLSMAITALSVSWFHLFLTEDRIVCDANGRLMIILISLAVGLIFFIVTRTFFFTHTIAGPVHKVGLVLQRAAQFQFDPEPLRFRKGDSFEDLETAVNSCVNSFKNIKTIQGELHNRLEILRTDITSKEINSDEIAEQLAEICEIVDGADQ